METLDSNSFGLSYGSSYSFNYFLEIQIGVRRLIFIYDIQNFLKGSHQVLAFDFKIIHAS